MLLSEIFRNVEYTCADFADCEIRDIVYSSRNAGAGKIFVALTGAFSDGHDYAQSAYLAGSRVFLLEKKADLPPDALCIYVKNSRAVLSQISANFFSHPDREIDVIGVTGTKGKTTVTHMLATSLNECGIKSGVIGTVGAYYDGNHIPTVNTTPESYEIHRILRIMADAGCKTCYSSKLIFKALDYLTCKGSSYHKYEKPADTVFCKLEYTCFEVAFL